MRAAEVGLIVLCLALVVIGSSFYWANRVDRLHRQIERARTSLQHQLNTRATAALELAHSAAIDPASAIVLAELAHIALTDESDQLDSASATLQSELSQAISMALGSSENLAALGGVNGPLLNDLTDAWYRAMVGRTFYNQAVVRTQRLRRTWGVRVFRLAGHAAMPQTYETEDRWPGAWGDGPT